MLQIPGALPLLNFATASLTSSNEVELSSMDRSESATRNPGMGSCSFGWSAVYNCSNYSSRRALCPSIAQHKATIFCSNVAHMRGRLGEELSQGFLSRSEIFGNEKPLSTFSAILLIYLSLSLLRRALFLRDRGLCFTSLATRLS